MTNDHGPLLSNVAGGLSAQARRRVLDGPTRAGKTRVIAIDGRSGAGKTTLARQLAAELSAPVVSLENLYDGWDGLERGIDLLVSEALEPLSAGLPARVPRYDWAARVWAEPWVLDPPEVLIVEGVGAGARRAAAYTSTLIWVAAPESVRKKRALDRDGATFAPYWDMWSAQEDAMLARENTPARADLIITAEDPAYRRSPANVTRKPSGREAYSAERAGAQGSPPLSAPPCCNERRLGGADGGTASHADLLK